MTKLHAQHKRMNNSKYWQRLSFEDGQKRSAKFQLKPFHFGITAMKYQFTMEFCTEGNACVSRKK
ncbi:hypothetical protein DPMN_096332 [Dreissena polymorpha]|uniref:Uncharacterized protein n=1 Tax=Dreissena polymorpha TaxID=45954 RepID=A0A9D4LAX3_DREPO|nr:hypothetical protein DPMN_096332 [Dreissena polymorpha]